MMMGMQPKRHWVRVEQKLCKMPTVCCVHSQKRAMMYLILRVVLQFQPSWRFEEEAGGVVMRRIISCRTYFKRRDDMNSVWVQLYVDKEKSGRVFEIARSVAPRNVDALCKAVKEERPNALKEVDAAELYVHESGGAGAGAGGTAGPESASTGTVSHGQPLDPGDPVPSRTSSRNPLIVVALPPAKHSQRSEGGQKRTREETTITTTLSKAGLGAHLIPTKRMCKTKECQETNIRVQNRCEVCKAYKSRYVCSACLDDKRREINICYTSTGRACFTKHLQDHHTSPDISSVTTGDPPIAGLGAHLKPTKRMCKTKEGQETNIRVQNRCEVCKAYKSRHVCSACLDDKGREIHICYTATGRACFTKHLQDHHN